MAAVDPSELGQMNQLHVANTTSTTRPEVAAGKSSHRSRYAPLLSRWMFDLFCALWIVPIVFLLVQNYRNWIVGAGVGCRLSWFKHKCYIDLLSIDGSNPESKAAKLDQVDHEILGALQFVAKALEVWFGIVATSLIYDLTMLLGKHDHGLPIAYLLTHVEFGDICMVVDHNFWKSSCLLSRQGRRGVYLFAISVALLCIICNLMGPATAVLVLPTLGWAETVVPNPQRLGQVANLESPKNPAIAPGCDASALAAGNFTCMSYFLPILDEMSLHQQFGLQELYDQGYLMDFGVFRESGLSYTFNMTAQANLFPIWSPNRQVLREMSNDYVEFQATQGANRTFEKSKSIAAKFNRTLDRTLYGAYRNVLDVTLVRRGPSLGMTESCARGNVTEIIVSEAKSVRCFYRNWSLDGVDNGYECIRVGTGWSDPNLANSQFSIGNKDNAATGNVTVDVYMEAESIWLRENILKCVSNSPDAATSCDWDKMFSGTSPDVEIYLQSQQWMTYTLPLPEGGTAVAVCHSYTFLDTMPYNIDISPTTNALGLVNLLAPSVVGDPIPLHPDWLLAAWAVTRSGVADGDRAAATNLVTTLKWAANSEPPETLDDEDFPIYVLNSLHLTTILHALTLVDFSTLNATGSTAAADDRAALIVSRRLRVWAYGHSSHTFRVGLVVVVCGVLCVFLRLGFGCFVASRHRCTLNFLTAALRYAPSGGEFNGAGKKSDITQVSVRVVDKGGGVVDIVRPHGNVRYRPLRGLV
ncbi:hypothetical protein PV08_04873 [Exophiala spinifera]|uniref:Transmembrane protein n=1 Tax=Exophiala spinifera TaxID=91928 RepID=A0A0D2BFA6_9EURO|nr:uncharacterized protein PV08_04873 [Exophiala spinifera]KIW17678.1 hypothetical protein PV08_04873 [Exophiala spinifera]